MCGTNSLYRLDPTTGVLTLIGNTGLSKGLGGLAFSAASVPEPASWSLLALGAALAVGYRTATKSRHRNDRQLRSSADSTGRCV